MGELVLAYNVQLNNKTSKPRAFYTLYIRLNDRGTGHSVFKLSTKSMIVTSRCKPIHMPDNVIEVVNQMGEDDESPDGMVFRNIDKKSTVEDMNRDVDSQDNSSCGSDKSWEMTKDGGQEDQKTIVYNDAVDDDEVGNLNKDLIQLRNGFGDNVNQLNNKQEYIEQVGVINEQDEQDNHFGNGNNNPQAQNKHFGAANEHNQNNANDSNNDNNNDKNLNQGGNNDNIAEVSEDGTLYNDQEFQNSDQEDNQQSDYDSAGDQGNDPNIGGLYNDDINGSDDNHDQNKIDLDENEEDNTGRNHT